MNTRQRMRLSNAYSTKWLLLQGYDEIWLKPHGRFNDRVYTKKGYYDAKDIFNLHDGICKDEQGYIFLQISTNKLHARDEYIEESKRYDISIMLLAPVTVDKESRQYKGIKVLLIRNGKITEDKYYAEK